MTMNAIISLPLGILMAFIVMYYQGVNANIMSLGGIAIAIGAMVDAAVVMIENAHKKIEHWTEQNPGKRLQGNEHWSVMAEAAAEVGPALFFSLLIITLSFIPVLMGYWIRGRIPKETQNPLNRFLIALYRPLLNGVLKWPKLTLVVAALVFASTFWPL